MSLDEPGEEDVPMPPMDARDRQIQAAMLLVPGMDSQRQQQAKDLVGSLASAMEQGDTRALGELAQFFEQKGNLDLAIDCYRELKDVAKIRALQVRLRHIQLLSEAD